MALPGETKNLNTRIEKASRVASAERPEHEPPFGPLLRSQKSVKALRKFALLTTIASGFSGLVYEVTWHKQLSAIVGSEARATAIILAVFLGGLALGYEIFGRLSRKISARNNVRILGYSEVVIGVWALVFNDIFAFILDASKNLPLSGPAALISEIAVGCMLILLPTTLMGGTLPLLTQGMSQGVADAPRFHAQIYSLNTLGAFLGCLLGGFFLIPAHGLILTLLFMSVVNIAVGIFLLLISFAMPVSDQDISKDQAPKSDKVHNLAVKERRNNEPFLPLWRGLVISFFAGFYAICLQTVLIRVTGLSMGSSEYAFSMVVSLYIGMLALGSMAVSRSKDISVKDVLKNQCFVLVGAVITYLSVPYWGYGNHLIRIIFANSKLSFYAYYLTCFVVLGGIVITMLSHMGRTLPLLFASIQLRKEKLGKDVGTIYGVNTLGCVLGAIFGGYLFLFVFDLDKVFQIALLTMVGSIFVLVEMSYGKKLWPFFLGCCALILILPQWNKKQLGHGLFRVAREIDSSLSGKDNLYTKQFEHLDLVAYKDAPSGTVAVYEKKLKKNNLENKNKDQQNKIEQAKGIFQSYDSSLSFFVNGKSDGDVLGDYQTTILLAHLPGLLHQSKTGNAAVIGFGTGVTVGGLTLYPEIKSIDCIEISSSVREFADYFSPYNWDAAKNPKVEWFTADAYRHLITTPKTYDLIVSEPSNPWVTGVEKLFSQEFYQMVKNKITDVGIYAQWFHGYSMSLPTMGMIFNTYHSVFPFVHTIVLRGDIIILGSMQELDSKNLELARQRLESLPQVRESLERIEINSIRNLIALEEWNPPAYYRDSGLHSLDFPKLAFAAGKDFFYQSMVDLRPALNNLEMVPWVHDFASRSLFSEFESEQFFKTESDRLQNISDFCRVKNIADIDLAALSSRNQPCRSLVLKGYKDGLIKVSTLPKQTPIAILTETYNPETWTTEKAKKFAEAFIYFNSKVSPIPRDELDNKTSICYQDGDEDLQCILWHSLGLLIAGFEDDAQSRFDRYKERIAKKMGQPAIDHWTRIQAQMMRLNSMKQSAHG